MQGVVERGEQIETVKISAEELVSDANFIEGWEDVMAGRPFNQAVVDDDPVWGYERGRQAAIYARHYSERYPYVIETDRDIMRLVAILTMMNFDGDFL